MKELALPAPHSAPLTRLCLGRSAYHIHRDRTVPLEHPEPQRHDRPHGGAPAAAAAAAERPDADPFSPHYQRPRKRRGLHTTSSPKHQARKHHHHHDHDHDQHHDDGVVTPTRTVPAHPSGGGEEGTTSNGVKTRGRLLRNHDRRAAQAAALLLET
eukprot:GHVU01199651.1.p1 GENE.GHVU01199651.1~~GHVU01199651.1.p1  ORF type:complete len:156 (+),score=13.76 GHVU01199651.1:22-489(+)